MSKEKTEVIASKPIGSDPGTVSLSDRIKRMESLQDSNVVRAALLEQSEPGMLIHHSECFCRRLTELLEKSGDLSQRSRRSGRPAYLRCLKTLQF